MKLEEFASFVDALEWKFAKTMPKNPHSYIVRERVDQTLFEDAVKFIRENGYVKTWFNKRYVYFDYNGHQYWTMGSPIPETTIMNRAVKNENL
jgi:hypothetical protein